MNSPTRAVEVPRVMRHFLEVRLQLAGVGVQHDHGGAVQVVARTRHLPSSSFRRPSRSRAPGWPCPTRRSWSSGRTCRSSSRRRRRSSRSRCPRLARERSSPPMVSNCHFTSPVLASTAKIGPQQPDSSPPLEPMMTLSLTTTGAPVKPLLPLLDRQDHACPRPACRSSCRWRSCGHRWCRCTRCRSRSARPRLYGL